MTEPIINLQIPLQTLCAIEFLDDEDAGTLFKALLNGKHYGDSYKHIYRKDWDLKVDCLYNLIENYWLSLELDESE